MSKFQLAGEYFCGNKASEYAIEQGYLDYATLAKAFDAVLANDLMNQTWGDFEWETVNGFSCYYENDDGDRISEDEYYDLDLEQQNEYREYYPDVFQHYIISQTGADILKDYTDEIVWYCEKLNLYVWGVTHCGTGWDYVLTDIPLNCEK